MTYEGVDTAADTDAVHREQARRSTRVELEPIGATGYRVLYAGEVLAEGRHNPIFDACRALLARGITGQLEVWRKDKPSHAMQLDIEKGAGTASRETAAQNQRIASVSPDPSKRPPATTAVGNTYDSAAEADADRAQQKELLTALNASDRALRRDECGAWTLIGKQGSIHTWGDGKSWVLFVACRSKQGWTSSKNRLAFCTVTQDGEDEGCLRLHQLPTPEQANVIRDVLGLWKRRDVSAAERERLSALLTGCSRTGRGETGQTLPSAIVQYLTAVPDPRPIFCRYPHPQRRRRSNAQNGRQRLRRPPMIDPNRAFWLAPGQGCWVCWHNDASLTYSRQLVYSSPCAPGAPG
jgi:hypothetical protein